jgi:hypothetical protein
MDQVQQHLAGTGIDALTATLITRTLGDESRIVLTPPGPHPRTRLARGPHEHPGRPPDMYPESDPRIIQMTGREKM